MEHKTTCQQCGTCILATTAQKTDGAIAHLAADPLVQRFNGRSMTSFEAAEIYGFTDLDGSQPNW